MGSLIWYIIAGIAAACAVGVLLVTYIRDRRYLKKRGLEAMGPELRAEIEQEREESRLRQTRFQAALQEAEEEEIGARPLEKR